MEKQERLDTFRIYPREVKILNEIMTREKIKSKSEAYRIALNTYNRNKDMIDDFQNLKSEVKELQNTIQVNSYLLQEALAEIKKLTRV